MCCLTSFAHPVALADIFVILRPDCTNSLVALDFYYKFCPVVVIVRVVSQGVDNTTPSSWPTKLEPAARWKPTHAYICTSWGPNSEPCTNYGCQYQIRTIGTWAHWMGKLICISSASLLIQRTPDRLVFFV